MPDPQEPRDESDSTDNTAPPPLPLSAPSAPFAAPAPAAGPTPYLILTRNQVFFCAIGALVLALVLTFFASLVVANRVVHGLDGRGHGFGKMMGPMGPGQGYGGPFRRYRGYGSGGQGGQGYGNGNGFPPFFPAPSAPAPSASPQSSS
jgi:hypothetical protein